VGVGTVLFQRSVEGVHAGAARVTVQQRLQHVQVEDPQVLGLAAL